MVGAGILIYKKPPFCKGYYSPLALVVNKELGAAVACENYLSMNCKKSKSRRLYLESPLG